MKTKKYLSVHVTSNDGSHFENPLKLSEAHFVSQLAQENMKVEVTCEEVSELEFKTIFG